MATRCFIAYKDGNIYKDIYCHNDGYLEYTGSILLEYYNTSERIKALLELGDLSFIGARLSEQDPLISNDDSVVFSYWRDRGESMANVQPRIHKDNTTLRFDAFAYLFEDGKWYYRTWEQPKYTPLG
ncbi:hypothetical protein [Flavobacterium azizsancarii]|uniref:hypothetical protein n=1 Tax=Flavobacterium azizsancarii TaxID=2961580 RepID=UPI002301E466|nr:hypothetical protein [Flavobacterium azizsancarii]